VVKLAIIVALVVLALCWLEAPDDRPLAKVIPFPAPAP
jgi:hypothetical protein